MQETNVYEFNDKDSSPPDSPVKDSINKKLAFPKFQILSQFFILMQKSRRPTQYKPILTSFFDKFFKIRDPIYTHAMLRLLFPQIDSIRYFIVNQLHRGTYGLKEMNFAKILKKTLVLGDKDYQRLVHYKNSTYQEGRGVVGDFVEVMMDTISNFLGKSTNSTVLQVNIWLDSLSIGDQGKKEDIMREIIRNTSAEEFKWIAKIILKDLKIGLSHEKGLNYFHPDALNYFNRTSSLLEVCKTLQDVEYRIENVLVLFQPIKPMLSKRENIDNLQTILDQKKFYIETKYDGERIQCHFDKEKMKFYSRNSHDYTSLYGPKMQQIIRDNLIECEKGILDGEIIVIDKETGQFIEFGMNKTIALQHEGLESQYQLCYKVFDVLYVKGTDIDLNLIEYTLDVRKAVLNKIIKPQVNQFEIVPYMETENLRDIFSMFNQSMEKNEEGIIIKQTDSIYTPNQRSNNWIKMKGDYIQGLADTLDLLIIGGYYGKDSYRTGGGGGDWTDNITHFLLGIALKLDKQNPLNCVFIPFCKVGTGYSKNQLQELRNQLRGFWVQNERPRYISQNWKPPADDRPDAYINSPVNSKILEIKAAEITKSNKWPAEYTLRFPRVEKIRYNKDWDECMNFEELKQLTTDLKRKKRTDSDDEEKLGSDKEQKEIKKSKGRKKQALNQSHEGLVLQQFLDTDVTQIPIESDLLKNMVFNIISCPNKKFLEENIHRNGGQKVQNDSQRVTHYVSDYWNFRVETLIQKYQCNILLSSYLEDTISYKKVQPLAPRYFLYINPRLSEQNKRLYDKYGDSYRDNIDFRELQQILASIKIIKTGLKDDLKKELKNEILDFFEAKHLKINQNPLKICFNKSLEEIKKDYELFVHVVALRKKGIKIIYGLQDNIDFICKIEYSEYETKQIQQYIEQNKFTQLKTLQQIQQIS